MAPSLFLKPRVARAEIQAHELLRVKTPSNKEILSTLAYKGAA